MVERYGERLGASTFTEPQAIVNAMCHLLSARRGSPKHVRVGTDSTVAQASYARGFNTHSFDINECLRRLRRTFGDTFTFEFAHVPGASNPADSLSRGATESPEKKAIHAESLRRLLGSEPVGLHGPVKASARDIRR